MSSVTSMCASPKSTRAPASSGFVATPTLSATWMRRMTGVGQPIYVREVIRIHSRCSQRRLESCAAWATRRHRARFCSKKEQFSQLTFAYYYTQRSTGGQYTGERLRSARLWECKDQYTGLHAAW